MTVAVRIAAEDQASGPIRGVGDALTGLEQRAAGASGTLGTLAKVGLIGVAAAATGVVAGLGGAVAAATGFERTMSAVGAVSGATGAEMQQLSALALQLGKDTSFSASEAAAGIEELVKGGLSIPDVMNGAAASMLDLAAAGGVSLPEAALIASNALNQFSLKGEDMAHVADLIAGAANASSLDVAQFGAALQQSGAVAATVGFSFDDLATGIALMGKAGIAGSDAGTSLKTMMLNLTPSTDKAASTMRELGIITSSGANQFFDATGKVKSFADVAGVLQTATKGMTEQQRLAALQVLFGTDAVRAAAVVSREGAAGFDTMAAAMGKVSAASVAAERLDNLAGSFEQLKGSVETAAITLGLALLPAIRGAIDGATDFVNGLIPFIQSVGPSLASMLDTIGTALGPLADGFRGAFAALAEGDFGGALEAIRAGIAGTFANILAGLGGFAQSMFGAGWTMIQSLAGGIMDAAGSLITAAVNYVADLIASFLIGFSPPKEGPLSRIDEGGYNVIASFAGGMASANPRVQAAVTEVTKNFDELAHGADGALDAVTEGLAAAAGNLEDLKGIAGGVEGALKTVSGEIRALDEASNRLKFTVDAIKDAYSDWLSPIQDALDEIKNFRDFSVDQKKIDFDRESLAIKQAEIGARGNKAAEEAVRKRRDEFNVRKDLWQIQQDVLKLDREQLALPLEKQIRDIKSEQKAVLAPLQDQLRIMDQQKKALDFQKGQWTLIKQAADEATKAATPKGGGGGGGGGIKGLGGAAKGLGGGGLAGAAGGVGASTAKALTETIKNAIPTGKDIEQKARDLGTAAAQSIGVGAQAWLSANLGRLVAGAVGAVVGAAVLGPVGLVGGAALGVSILNGVTSAFAERGVDVGALAAPLLAQLQEVGARVTSFVEQVRGLGLAGVWREIQAAMGDFAPTAANVGTVLEGLGAAIGRLVPQPLRDFVGGVVSLALAAGEGRGPIGLLADAVNTVSGAIAGATQFVKDHVAAQALLVGILAGAATAWGIVQLVTGVGLAISGVTTAVQAARGAWLALNLVMAANPIGVVLVVLAGLAAALIYAYQNSEEFREVVDNAFAVVKGAAETAMRVILPALRDFALAAIDTAKKVAAFVSDVVGFFANLRQNVTTATTTVQTAVTTAWEGLRTSVSGAASAILTAVSDAFDALDRGIRGVQDAITGYILQQWTDAIPQDIRDGLQEVGDLLAERWAEFRRDVSDKMAAIVTAVQTGWASVTTGTGTEMGKVRAVVRDAWNAVSAAVRTVLEPLVAFVAEQWANVQRGTVIILDAVLGYVTALWLTLKANVLTPLGEVLAAVQETWTAVEAAIRTALDAALAAVVAFGAGMLATLGGLVTETLIAAKALGQAIIDGIKDAIRAGAGAIGDLLAQLARDAIDAAKRALGARSPSREFVRVGQTIPEGLMVGIRSGADRAAGAVRTVVQRIIDAATGEQITRWPAIGAAIVARVAEGITDTTTEVVGAITALGDRAGEALRDLTEDIGGKWSGWISEVIAKRTELLRRFNYEAFKRGEGTKVLEPLEDATRDYLAKTEAAVRDASTRLVKLATEYQGAVLAARAEAAKQVQGVVADAAAKIAELTEARSLQRRIDQQKTAFAQMQRVQKDAFDAQQRQLEGALKLQEDAARIAFQAQLKFGRVGVDAAPGVTAAQAALDARTEELRINFELQRDLGRATTAEQKQEITQRAGDALRAMKDRLDEEKFLLEATRDLRLALQREQIAAEREQAMQALRDQQAEALYVEEQTAALRTQILARQVAMEQIVEQQRRDFDERLEQEAFDRQVARIETERDERIRGVNEALAAKEAALAASYETERQAVIDALREQLQDYQTEYIDKVKAAFQQAGVDIVDFLDTINNDLKRRTQETADQIIRMADELARMQHSIGGTPSYGYAPAPSLPNTMPNSPAAPVVLPDTTLPRVSVNVYPLTADLNENALARELWRQGVLGGG